MTKFAGFGDDNFSAYSKEKWSSNVHNLIRMKSKDLMVALADQVGEALGDDLKALDRVASDDTPNITNHKKVDAQWVYWYRNAEARKDLKAFLQKTPLESETIFDISPYDKHISIALILRETELWLGIWLAPGAVVDRRNLASRLEKSWEREALRSLLGELPEGAKMGPVDETIPTNEVTLDLLEDYSQSLIKDKRVWFLGHSVERADALEFGEDLADHVPRWLGALLPLFRYVVWTRNNDHIAVGKEIQEQKQEKRREALGFKSGDHVRITSGLFAGKRGEVQDVDARGQVRIRVGKMSVVMSGTDVVSL